MNEFVEECRREWRRLGVPDPVANEMAADLIADLDEAHAEGGTPEDVLGNSAFDPRRFAGAWAMARGVTGPPPSDPRRSWRPALALALTIFLVVLTLAAALVLAGGRSSAVATFAVHGVAAPGAIRILPTFPRHFAPRSLGPFAVTQFPGAGVQPAALILLLVCVVGLGLLAALYWWPRSGPRRFRRPGGPRSPSWN